MTGGIDKKEFLISELLSVFSSSLRKDICSLAVDFCVIVSLRLITQGFFMFVCSLRFSPVFVTDRLYCAYLLSLLLGLLLGSVSSFSDCIPNLLGAFG